MARKYKRITVLSDTHCGHQYGMTPPGWQYPLEAEDVRIQGIAKLQRQVWSEFESISSDIGISDLVVCLSDSIDGKGQKSGGNEQITTDRRLQCEIAKKCVLTFRAKKYTLLHGTAYHTGDEEDWDAVLASMIGGDVHSRSFVRVTPSNKRFHFRHHVGASSIPHGRHTPPSREMLWLKLWESNHNWPRTDIGVFGHVHYYTVSGNAYGTAYTCPALELNTKFGARRCSGDVDWGVLSFRVYDNGEVCPDVYIVNFEASQPEEVVV